MRTRSKTQPRRTPKQKFRFVVTGTFELEINAESQGEARVAVWRALDKVGVGDLLIETEPSRDWQVINGGRKS